jgi:hypothetical protein
LYRTKRRYGRGITKDYVAKQDKTGPRGHTGFHRPIGQGQRTEGIIDRNKTDGIIQNQQNMKVLTRST